MFVPDRSEAIVKGQEISREDLATYLCTQGWSPRGESLQGASGRVFIHENDDFMVALTLGECDCKNCFVVDLVKVLEASHIIEEHDLTVIDLVDEVKERVATLTPEYVDHTMVVQS